MSQIQVFTDTGADMTDILKENGVTIVPLYITFDGQNYLKQMEEVSIEEFYTRMRQPHDFHPKTSLASIQDYVDIFTPYLNEGKDVLYLVMNANFSSTYGAAINAKRILEADFPDRRIEIVDSTTVTYGQYYLTKVANDLAKQGKDMKEILLELDRLKPGIKYYFTVETLQFLKSGGRIGKASALVGDMLNIKPIIEMAGAELLPLTKVRGRKKSLSTLLEYVHNEVDGHIDEYEITLLNGDAKDEDVEFANTIKEEFNLDHVDICMLGLSIGLHAGPGTLGISVIKK